jgi:ADP-heptose:LPS heptosyltransferase
VPALRALRRALPDHRLVLAAPEPLRPLVELGDAVDELLPTGELAPVPWRGEPPDVAVNLHGRGPQSHRLLRGLAPGRLVGFANDQAGEPGPAWRADEHERSRWCRLVASAFDVPADPDDVRLAVPGLEPAVVGAVVVHPGAAYPSRRWPPDRFAAVARWAAGRQWPVVVTGGPDETDLARQVATGAGLSPSAVLAGRTDLEQLAAVVASARVVVCGDTGVAHLASAYGTPSVLLFGPTPPAAWGPPPGPHRVLWRGSAAADPFAADPDPALLDIAVSDVLDELAVLENARADERAGPVPSGIARSSVGYRPADDT